MTDAPTTYFLHERLDVFQVSLEFAAWIHKQKRHIPTQLRNQLTRAAESVVLNLCEGTGRSGGAQRNHYEIAYASAAECHGAVSLCKVYGVPHADEALHLLHRVRRMLAGLQRRR